MKQVQAVNNQVESIYGMGLNSLNDNKRGSTSTNHSENRHKKYSVSQPPSKAEGIKSIRTMTSSNFN